MSVKVTVIGQSWWDNFWKETDQVTNFHWKLDDKLVQYYGRNVPGTTYLEFDTEADAAAFILKWST